MPVLFIALSRTHWKKRLHSVCILAWAGAGGSEAQPCWQAVWCLGLSAEEVAASPVSCSPWGTEFNQGFQKQGLQKIILFQLTSVVRDLISRLTSLLPCCAWDMVSGVRLQGYRCLPVLEVSSPKKPALCKNKCHLYTLSFASVCAELFPEGLVQITKPSLCYDPPQHAQKWLHL